MVWFRTLFGTVKEPPLAGGSEAGVRVRHDEMTITVFQPDGLKDTMAWNDIARVIIETTDEGPFAADLFWLIDDSAGRRLTIPMGASGECELLKLMQRRLEAFDNMIVVEAMGSTERARFVVWEADGE